MRFLGFQVWEGLFHLVPMASQFSILRSGTRLKWHLFLDRQIFDGVRKVAAESPPAIEIILPGFSHGPKHQIPVFLKNENF
jgi:hypothetical protein